MATLTIGNTQARARDATPELEAAQQLEEVARFLDLEKWIVQRLHYCEREVEIHSQLLSDSGEPRIIRALRVQHSSVRGSGMGPLAFSKSLSVSAIHAIAMELTWQWALWKLPFSGAAGLISADLQDLSEREARLLIRDYVSQIRPLLGPQSDIIASARDSHSELMAWAVTSLGAADPRTSATITGKPMSLGGVDIEGVAARFFRLLFTCAMRQLGTAAKGARVVMIGFDRSARRIALELERTGARVIGIADRTGGVHDDHGLNVGLLVQHSEHERGLFGYPEAEPVSLDDLLKLTSDALILCGPENLTHVAISGVIFEAGGEVHCTVPARTVVVPSILADFGLSFASFCEWRKNSCGGFAEVDGLRGLPVHVRNTWHEVWDYAQRYALTLSRAALALAVSRVAEAMRLK